MSGADLKAEVRKALDELANSVKQSTIEAAALIAEAHGAKQVAQDILKLAKELQGKPVAGANEVRSPSCGDGGSQSHSVG